MMILLGDALVFVLLSLILKTAKVRAQVNNEKISLPNFKEILANYPGYSHHEGNYGNKAVLDLIGCAETSNILLHDTSALRLSYALNAIAGEHSLGTSLIKLSTNGRDSVEGKDGLQYVFHPLAFGPYLADKYGYPNVSKAHQINPVLTKNSIAGKQGILQVITYTKHGNEPRGHVALWDCNHFHQSKDWIDGHTLVSVAFWETPDSKCSPEDSFVAASQERTPVNLMQNTATRRRYLKRHLLPVGARHRSHKLRAMGHL